MLVPGSPAIDAPLTVHGKESWFLKLLGNEFTGIYFARDGESTPQGVNEMEQDAIGVKTIVITPGSWDLADHKGLLRQRLDGQPGSYHLFRPDQHLVARWREFDLQAVRDAVAQATMQRASGDSA